jgi:hypothetical protein
MMLNKKCPANVVFAGHLAFFHKNLPKKLREFKLSNHFSESLWAQGFEFIYHTE